MAPRWQDSRRGFFIKRPLIPEVTTWTPAGIGVGPDRGLVPPPMPRIGANPFRKPSFHMTTDSKHCIDVCNRLLRGERSAVETYDKAISKYGDKPVLDDLHAIRAEHATAVNELEANVRSMGGEPETDSGAWGALANTVQSAANLFGSGSALEALESGEEMGASDYRAALEDDEVMPECKSLIRGTLLPRTEAHIAKLKMLERAS